MVALAAGTSVVVAADRKALSQFVAVEKAVRGTWGSPTFVVGGNPSVEASSWIVGMDWKVVVEMVVASAEGSLAILVVDPVPPTYPCAGPPNIVGC